MADTIVRISEAGSIGLVSDKPYHLLPPEAWSDAQNVRFRDGLVEKFLGHTKVYDPPTIAPYWLLPFEDETASYWIYPGLDKVYVYDGTNHVNITRQTAAVDVDYNATALFGWNGGVLNGVPILNNGIDAPQMWNPSGVANKLLPLTWNSGNTWDSLTYTTDVIRPFRDFLIGLGFYDGTGYDPTLLLWSASAEPGSEPATWDPADATADAGQRPLSETNEALIDCVPLGNTNMIYKQNMVYAMQWIGGQEIFSVNAVFREFGMLTRRCAKQFFGKHLVFTGGDVVVHDGTQAQSIVNSKVRRWLFSNIDETNFGASFVVPNYSADEMWLCFPSAGQSLATLALVWNWTYNTFGVRELPGVAHIGFGQVNPGGIGPSWDADSGPWDADSSVWGLNAYTPTMRRLLMARPAGPSLLVADNGNKFDTDTFASYVERKGMPFIGTDQRGNPIADLSKIKHITRVWPRITMLGGETINIYVGKQDRVGGTVEWSAAYTFDPATQTAVDTPDAPTGVLTAIKFESVTDLDWKLHGYDIELSVVGSLT